MPPGNRNSFIHPPAQDFPASGAARAVYLARLLSLLFGSLAVAGTALLLRELQPGQTAPALAAAALLAFTPQWLFIASSASNDALFAGLCALTLWLLASLLRRPATRGRLLWLGGLLGLAMLAKAGGVVLAAFCAPVLLYAHRAHRAHRRQPLSSGAPPTLGGTYLRVYLPAALLAGWWYLRNLALYGDPTALTVLGALSGWRADSGYSFAELLGEFRGLRWSYWGLFGWFNILLPLWAYTLLDALTALAMAGLALRLRAARRPEERAGLLLLLAWAAVGLLVLIPWSIKTRASQGRLLYAQVAALHGLFALGLQRLAGRRARLLWLAPAAFLALAAVTPFAVIAPQYARPAALPARDVPPSAALPKVTFAPGLRLLAVEAPAAAQPGSTASLTLYWRADRLQNRDLLLHLRLLGRDLQPVASSDSYPGWGTWPVALWAPGQVYRDSYRLPVDPSARTPALARWALWFEDRSTGEQFYPLDGQGALLQLGTGIAVTRLPPAGRQQAAAPTGASSTAPPQVALDVRFDDFARLTGASLEGNVLTLYWEALAPAADDFTVFIHLSAPGRAPLAADGPPFEGFYPTTAWAAGDRMADAHRLPDDLPPGRYALSVGLYRPADGARAAARGPQGDLPDGVALLPLVVAKRAPPGP